jgi:hypothetical protein
MPPTTLLPSLDALAAPDVVSDAAGAPPPPNAGETLVPLTDVFCVPVLVFNPELISLVAPAAPGPLAAPLFGLPPALVSSCSAHNTLDMAQPVPVSKRSGPANAGLARTAAAKELINIADFIVHILPPSSPLARTNGRERNSL